MALRLKYPMFITNSKSTYENITLMPLNGYVVALSDVFLSLSSFFWSHVFLIRGNFYVSRSLNELKFKLTIRKKSIIFIRVKLFVYLFFCTWDLLTQNTSFFS